MNITDGAANGKGRIIRMIRQALLKVIAPVLVALSGTALGADVGLPILVLVERDPSFYPSYRYNRSYHGSHGSTVTSDTDRKVDHLDREEVVQKLAGEITSRLRKHDSGGTLHPDLCENAEEMIEKANSGKGYLCLRVTVKAREESKREKGGLQALRRLPAPQVHGRWLETDGRRQQLRYEILRGR